MRKTTILLFLLCLLLSGCGYGTDVENQAFVIAVGIDKGNSFPLKVSFVFANPGGNESEGGAPSAPKPDIISVEAPTVFSAVRKLDSIKSKAINLSHTKVVVFAKEKAEEGIKEYLSGFASSRDFRPNTYVCVSECDAEKFLKNIKPSHETFIEKYFDNIMQKVAEDKVNEAYLYYLYYNMTEDFSGSLVPLVGVNENKLSENNTPPEMAGKDDLEYEKRAGEILRDGKNPAEILGCAVFKNDKMIGTLGSFHADLARIIGNEFYPRNYSVSYPEDADFVTVRINQEARTEIKTKIINNKVYINITVPISLEYIDAGKIENHTEESKKFCKFLENKFKKESERLISYSQRTQNCDFLGLGNSLKHHFPDIRAWKKFNWENKYQYAQINVSYHIIYADFEEAN